MFSKATPVRMPLGRRFWALSAALIAMNSLGLPLPPASEAGNLTDVLEQGFTIVPDQESALGTFSLSGDGSLQNGNLAVAGAAIAPAFSQAIAQAVTQEFPLASVAPAFSYRYNSSLNLFERASSVLGPLFSERAPTLGKGQFNFSIAYSFINFNDLNGTDLDDMRSPGLLLETFPQEVEFVPLPTGESVLLAPLALSQLRTKIDLQAHVIAPTFRYGILDNLDVSISIPIVNTFLRVKNESLRVADLDPEAAVFAGLFDAQGELLDAGFLDPTTLERLDLNAPLFVQSQRPSKTVSRAADSATGIGDISLRAKYQAWRTEEGGASLGLNLLLPTGNEKNFHGTNETHISPFVFVSHIVADRFEPHLNIGLDFNADDVDRSSFLYAAGATLLVWEGFGLMVDFIGRSEFGRVPVRIPQTGFIQELSLDKAADTCTAEQRCAITSTAATFSAFPGRIKRNDIADFSFGFRYVIGTAGSIFFGGLIPLNDDGFRADFIPSGGIEYTF